MQRKLGFVDYIFRDKIDTLIVNKKMFKSYAIR